MSAGTNLAAFAARLQWDALPHPLRAKLLDHVVDIIGVMFAGINVEVCASARRAAHGWGQGDEATVAGLQTRYPAPTAAFLNALHARIHTYDDTYEPGTMHSGSPVVSATLALAETQAVDGPTFLAAVFAGYEVATRVAAAVSPSHYAAGFHNTGTCAVFGAAAAGARILGLDGQATAEALGLAGATAAGLRQHQIDGSIFDTAFHGARAAQSGVMVAQLRAQGVRGPAAILDGPMGFCAVMAPTRDLSRLDAELGSRYEFSEMTIKPYPTCRFVHGPIEAALQLKHQHKLDPAHITELEIATFRQSMEVSDRAEIPTPFDAVVSHQYTVALALVKNKVALSSFSGEALGDPVVLGLMRKVRVVNDPELERLYPKCWPHRVTITMSDGRQVSTLSEYPPGRATPIPRQAVDEKFLENSTPHLGAQRSAQVLEMIRGLEGCKDVRTVATALRPQA